MSVFDSVGPITLPVPPETVALLRMPLPLTALSEVIDGLQATYGDGLVVRTDTDVEGWIVIARPDQVEGEYTGWLCPSCGKEASVERAVVEAQALEQAALDLFKDKGMPEIQRLTLGPWLHARAVEVRGGTTVNDHKPDGSGS